MPSARMCLARPLARNEGLGRGGRPALIPPHTSLTHTSVCTVLHLVVFGESTLVSTMAATVQGAPSTCGELPRRQHATHRGLDDSSPTKCRQHEDARGLHVRLGPNPPVGASGRV